MRLEKNKTTKQKKHRVRTKMSQLKKETLIAVKERSKRDGTYKRGRNMAEGSSGGFTAEELERGNKKRRSNADVICKHCQKKGHSRMTHRDCDKYNGNKKRSAVPPPQEANSDADEAEAMDSMPFVDDDDDIFLDAHSWSDDEGITRAQI